MQKNDWGDDRGDIVCGVPPPRWVADALALELTRSGFRVLRDDRRSAHPPDSLVVRGTVFRLFVEPTVHLVTREVTAEIGTTLLVTNATGLREERTVHAKGVETVVVAGESTYQSVTDAATRDLAKQMAAEIIAIFDRASRERNAQ